MSTAIELPTPIDKETVKPRTILEAFRFSIISFYEDVSRADGLVIPVGVMAEVHLPHRLYALGLIARTGLSNEELRNASLLARPLVAKPFKYLAEQFEIAWNECAPGAALTRLAEQHSYSALRFSAPERLPFNLIEPESVLRAQVRSQIGGVLDGQMSQLVERPIPHIPRTIPQEELLQLKAEPVAA
jgi:hypothetical protein